MNRKERRAQAAQDRKLPRYFDAALQAALRNRELYGPGLTHVFVQHDDWCDLLNGRGACNCNPDVTSRPDRTN